MIAAIVKNVRKTDIYQIVKMENSALDMWIACRRMVTRNMILVTSVVYKQSTILLPLRNLCLLRTIFAQVAKWRTVGRKVLNNLILRLVATTSDLMAKNHLAEDSFRAVSVKGGLVISEHFNLTIVQS